MKFTPNDIAKTALRKAGKYSDVAYVQIIEEMINNLLAEEKVSFISLNGMLASTKGNKKSNDRNKIKMKPQIILTTETEVFQQADIMSSIRQLQTVMKDWQDTLKNNSIDGDIYSRGLLIGYEAAMRQVVLWLGEYYA